MSHGPCRIFLLLLFVLQCDISERPVFIVSSRYLYHEFFMKVVQTERFLYDRFFNVNVNCLDIANKFKMNSSGHMTPGMNFTTGLVWYGHAVSWFNFMAIKMRA